MAGELRTAFDASVKASAEIDDSLDSALVATGRALADEIDYAIGNLSGQERTKALYLVPHLMNVMKEMLATPAARRAAGLGAKEDGTVGTLGKLRLAHGKKGA